MNKYIYEYQPGDVADIRWYGAGFITSSGTSLRITIPLDKPVKVKSATLSGNLTLRQGSKYIYGSSNENTPIENLNQTFQGFYTCGATFAIAKNDGYTDVTNNDAVGVLFDGTISFN